MVQYLYPLSPNRLCGDGRGEELHEIPMTLCPSCYHSCCTRRNGRKQRTYRRQGHMSRHAHHVIKRQPCGNPAVMRLGVTSPPHTTLCLNVDLIRLPLPADSCPRTEIINSTGSMHIDDMNRNFNLVFIDPLEITRRAHRQSFPACPSLSSRQPLRPA